MKLFLLGVFTFIFSYSNAQIGQPVTVISFDAKLEGNRVKLYWDVAVESELSHYNIEMSIDGINYNTIGRVESKTNSSVRQSYSFYHTYTYRDAGTTLYFRLVSIYLDGSKTYQITRSVSISNLKVLYNVNGNNIHIYSDKSVVKIYDMSGRLLFTYNNKEIIELRNLKGIYIFIIYVDNKIYKEKILK
jgi:hypothetical protein